ncbi:transcriptional regulator [Streptomyces telluris]|uniref:Transcriptional regulator n=1 Tax=Streptomyces telluris TaxID=2720021 RepID=A0A9X2LD09_9ACTN|nr:transcriptional regulator [Streptomyces telluris]MCQ8768923.1 transcriptional regulator [Streptomyces telluris]
MRWQTSPTRFTEVTAVLPALIGDVEHSVRAHRTGPDEPARREVLRAAADLFFLLRSYLRRTGRTDLALLAADRAARAAEDADDPLRIPAAQWNLGHALLGSGDAEQAQEVAVRAIDRLAAHTVVDRELLAMSGALHLVAAVAAVAAARRRHWWAARARISDQARPAALRVGEGNVMWTAFGPTNVELHSIRVEMEAGEAGEALRMADAVDMSAPQSLERAFTFAADVAHCHHLRREDPAVLLQLLELERLAPEDLARSAVGREMTLGLIRRGRPLHARKAELLAERLGLL